MTWLRTLWEAVSRSGTRVDKADGGHVVTVVGTLGGCTVFVPQAGVEVTGWEEPTPSGSTNAP